MTKKSQRKIIQNATRKNKLMTGGNDVQDSIPVESNLQDVVDLIANLRRNRELLLLCAVFMELIPMSSTSGGISTARVSL